MESDSKPQSVLTCDDVNAYIGYLSDEKADKSPAVVTEPTMEQSPVVNEEPVVETFHTVIDEQMKEFSEVECIDERLAPLLELSESEEEFTEQSYCPSREARLKLRKSRLKEKSAIRAKVKTK